MSDMNRKGFGKSVNDGTKAPAGKTHTKVDKAVGGPSEQVKGRVEEPRIAEEKDLSTVERKR